MASHKVQYWSRFNSPYTYNIIEYKYLLKILNIHFLINFSHPTETQNKKIEAVFIRPNTALLLEAEKKSIRKYNITRFFKNWLLREFINDIKRLKSLSKQQLLKSSLAFHNLESRWLLWLSTLRVIWRVTRGCLLYFGIWQPWCCDIETKSAIVKFHFFELTRTQNVLIYKRYLFCLH